MKKINNGGFSWSKLLGVSATKARVSRKIGIPLTKSGRQQKIGRIKSGKCGLFLFLISLFLD